MFSGLAFTQNESNTRSVGIDQGINQMFESLDINKNGQLSLEEFKQGVIAERKQAMVLQRLNSIFRQADNNNNGYLTETEFNAMPPVTKAGPVKPKFVDFDANKDSKMSFREFLYFIEKSKPSNNAG